MADKEMTMEEVNSKKTVLAIVAILVGFLGIHKFMMGKTVPGIIHICTNILCLGGIIGLVEGIIYLTKKPEDFKREYLDGDKAWF